MTGTPLTELEVRMQAERLGYPVEVDRDDADELQSRAWVLIRHPDNLNVYFRRFKSMRHNGCPWRVFAVRKAKES